MILFSNIVSYTNFLGALNLLVRKAHLLIENENNNRCEQLMNIVSRFNMGKQLNLIQRGSCERRVQMSALRYNRSSFWYESPWKRFTNRSPGKHCKNYMSKCNLIRRKKYKEIFLKLIRVKVKVKYKRSELRKIRIIEYMHNNPLRTQIFY